MAIGQAQKLWQADYQACVHVPDTVVQASVHHF